MWDFRTDGADWDEELKKRFGGWEDKKPPPYFSKLGKRCNVNVYGMTFNYDDGEGHYADLRLKLLNGRGDEIGDERGTRVKGLFVGGPTSRNIDKIKKHILFLYPLDKR
jgi:hypothetical protein